MSLYLEQYMDSLQGLPADLQRNLKLLRELDGKAQQGLRDLDSLTKAYVRGARGWNHETQAKHYKEIDEKFSLTKGLGEDKVSIAAQTYEMVDKHIRRLDSDLTRFETDIKRRFLDGRLASDADDSPDKKATPTTSATRKSKPIKPLSAAQKRRKLAALTGDNTPKSASKKRKGAPASTGSPPAEGGLSGEGVGGLDAEQLAQLSGTALFQQLAGGGGDVMDMPVDPNEPTYCVCHQVSYGEMVGCDNADCPIEWFHFGCVGLTTKPKGKWFCPRCTDERRKKRDA